MEDTPGASPNRRQRTLYRVLTIIFLSTLPCYCAGIVALVAFVPEEGSQAEGTPVEFLPSPTTTPTPQFTPTSTVTPGGPTVTLFPTPSQFIPPPTNTPTPTPTNTPVPTDTPAPTDTGVPTNTPTLTPIATVTKTATSTNPDTDGDGLPDAWEIEHFGDLTRIATGDPDLDDLTNLSEYEQGTDPNKFDTDDDTLSDGDEVFTHLTDPLKPDTDDGGLDDGTEVDNPPCDPLDGDDDDSCIP